MNNDNEDPILKPLTQIDIVDPMGAMSFYGNRDVHDYLFTSSYLLNTGTHAAPGDGDPYSWVSPVIGWAAQGEPRFPPPI